MKLEVKNLVFAQVGESESFNIELFNEKIDEDVIAERIRGSLKLTKLEDQILAKVTGTTRVKVSCDRCLVDYCLDLPLKFSQEYLLNRAEAVGDQMAVSAHFEVEVLEPLRQEILAAIPVKKLCQAECAGMCLNCGKNLNAEKCVCKSKGQ